MKLNFKNSANRQDFYKFKHLLFGFQSRSNLRHLSLLQPNLRSLTLSVCFQSKIIYVEIENTGKRFETWIIWVFIGQHGQESTLLSIHSVLVYRSLGSCVIIFKKVRKIGKMTILNKLKNLIKVTDFFYSTEMLRYENDL